MLKGCVSKEFRALRANVTAPLTLWLRALAADVFPRCGGKGVGAIGMCFTGNFALSMMLEPVVRAPVLCQPSLPLGQTGGMHIAPDDLARVKTRLDREDLTVLAYRFAGDAFCRAERFAAYQAALGDRFVPTVLDDACAHPHAMMKNPHGVVTEHLIDRDGEPTRKAVHDILDFFRERLG
jgi:dienelactone hydrolase